MTEDSLSALNQSISFCMSKDRYRLRRLYQKIQTLKRQKKPFDRELGRLSQAVESSQKVVSQRQQALPKWTYPESLPVSERCDDIVKAIQQNQVIIIAGETGSGKTTQIPKMCLQAGLGVTGFIGHTQPRRIAARSVGQRIAEELQSTLGQCVGYKVRFQDQMSDTSLIKLMTDGILLAEIPHDRFLSQYDVIIIDEAHERTLNIDFLLGYLKRVLPKRPELKVIITSATIDHWRFSRFFDDAQVIEVSGRTFPVEVLYRAEEDATSNTGEDGDDAPSDDEGRLERAIVDAVKEIGRLERANPNASRPGDILVFLSGEREIRLVADCLRKQAPNHTEILPLYARLTNAEQNRIFQSHPGRRIVLSTNVAETSITVPNIGYVIDSGLARVSRYSYRSKVQRLPIERISQASANQRAGRCGRIAEGICIRLYSEDDFTNRAEYTEPEILRTNLASVILQMQGLRLGEVTGFPFIDPPDTRLVNDGYRLLEELQAVDAQKQVSSIGRTILRFPVDPRIGRMLVAAKEHHCLREMMVIASGMSVQEPWQRPHDRQGAADQSLQQFQHEDSDFLTFVNIWEEAHQQREDLTNNQYRRWLLKRFLSYLRMREWQDVYRQLKQACHEAGWQENTEPARYEEVHKAILSGLLSHVATRNEKGYLAVRNRSLTVFPGSALAKRKPKWVMAAEIVETQKVFGRTVAKLEPEWVEQVGGLQLKKTHFEPHWEKKRACAVAYEQTTLFGLIINPKKKVNYSIIDPVCSREIFIQHALVLRDYASSAPFFAHNHKLIDSLEYLEAKSRRRDILIDDVRLYDLYDEILPVHIVNGKSFESWRKKAERDNPAILFLKKDQLIQKEQDSNVEQAYPDQMNLEGGKLNIDYQFEPGKLQDGLNMEVPVTLINQVNEEKLEWLVPGLEKEKCVAMIKCLPKAIRRYFVPAPDFADAFLNTQPDRERSLKVQFAAFLRSKKSVNLTPEQWDDVLLPSHLRANLKVLGGKGNVLAEGREIRQIKLSLQGEFQASLKQLTQDHLSQEVHDHWAFDTIPDVYETRKNGVLIKAFPALFDQENGVCLQLMDTEFVADQTMKKGLLRLFLLALPQQLRYIKKNHGLPKNIAVKYAPFGDQKSLSNGLAEMAFFRAFIAGQKQVRTEKAFQQRLQDGKGNLIQSATDIQNQVATILNLHHDVISALNKEASPAKAETRQDIRSQLSALFPQDWITAVSFDALQHYPRYLQAALIRWQRLQGKIQRDQELIQELMALWKQYEARKRKHGQEGVLDSALESWRWALEEYRVSVFAQGIKTAYPVSYKRLQKMWELVLA